MAGDDRAAAVHGPNEFWLTDAQLLTHVTVGPALQQNAGCGGLQVVRQASDRRLEVGAVESGDELLVPGILSINHIEVEIVCTHDSLFRGVLAGRSDRQPPDECR